MTTDVNAEFFTTRIQQLADAKDRHNALEKAVKDGQVRKNSNGTYTVLTGWDQGEVLDGTGMPRHGLDVTETGDVKLYLKDTPAWHSLGTVIDGGLSSVDNVLKVAGLDYTVGLRKARYLPDEADDQNDADSVPLNVPDYFVTIREDTKAALGVVGNRYVPIQNSDAYSFLESLFADNLMICETAGSRNNGRDVFISAELPTHLIIDPTGFADYIRQYIIIQNNHSGRSPLVASTTPWRPVCANTERFGVRDAVSKWAIRHTRSAPDRMKEARRALGLTTAYYEQWAEEENALAQTPFFFNQVDALIREVWGELDKDATKVKRTRWEGRRDTLMELFNVETARVGTTAYAAERAVTALLDHHTGRKNGGRHTPLEALGVAILEDSTTTTKTKAHEKLMQLVR